MDAARCAEPGALAKATARTANAEALVEPQEPVGELLGMRLPTADGPTLMAAVQTRPPPRLPRPGRALTAGELKTVIDVFSRHVV